MSDVILFVLFLSFFTLIWTVGSTNVILDVTCASGSPLADLSEDIWFESRAGSVDTDVSPSFARSIDTGPGANSSFTCRVGDKVEICGLPNGTSLVTGSTNGSVQVWFDPKQAGVEVFGVFDCHAEKLNRSSSLRTFILNREAEILPDIATEWKFTKTASLGENILLSMTQVVDTGESLVWRFGGNAIIESANETTLEIVNATKSDGGVYECYHEGKEEFGQHGIMDLYVRGCRADHWNPPDCDRMCPDCRNGGICDDVTGICICPPGFTGVFCERACGHNRFGRDCQLLCNDVDPSDGCRGKLLCLSYPYGCSCAPGFRGLDCMEECSSKTFGIGCRGQCHCNTGDICDTATGACNTGSCMDRWSGPQCQFRIIDFTLFNGNPLLNRDTPENEEFRGYVIAPDFDAVMSTGRLEYTGTGQVGYTSPEPQNNGDIVSLPEGSGFPVGTTLRKNQLIGPPATKRFFVKIPTSGVNETAGVYFIKASKLGANAKVATFISDSEATVWPTRYTVTTGIGESATLGVNLLNITTTNLRWIHNAGEIITEWNGRGNVTIEKVRKSDEGVYECFVDGTRLEGKHALMQLVVRDCPMMKWGPDCSEDCPVCYNGGMCDDNTGQCICPPGFDRTDNCMTACGDNNFGHTCGIYCSKNTPGCPNKLFCLQDPIGCSCIAGYSGYGCESKCMSGYYGANCELECHCEDCDRALGCSDGTCYPGYTGPQCQEPLYCPAGYYGDLCKSRCHCVDGGDCGRYNGTCAMGCADGWAGNDCQQALPQLTDDPEVFVIQNVSATVTWNSWRYGYDHGTGPVAGYTMQYRRAGNSNAQSVFVKDSVARVELSPYIVYEFRVQAMKEVDGRVAGGVWTGWVSDMTLCGVPIIAPTITSTNVEGPYAFTFTWSIPEPSTYWLRCEVESFVGYVITITANDDPSDEHTLFASTNDTQSYVDNLKVCTVYEIQIRANNTVGEGPYSWPPEEVLTGSIAPSPIDSIDVIATSNSEVHIQWTEPFSTCEVTDYVLTYQLITRDQCLELNGTISTTNTSETEMDIDLLETFSTYRISIAARSQGVASNGSYVDAVTDEGVPRGSPTDITPDSSKQNELTYTWDESDCGYRQGIIIAYDCIFWEDTPGSLPHHKSTNTRTVTFTEDVQYFTWYNFTVRANTSMGSGPFANTVKIRSAEGAPGSAPRNVTIVNAFSRSLNLSWLSPEIPNGVINRYDIEAINRDTNIPIHYVKHVSEEQSVVYFEISQLEPDQEYSIQVQAYTKAGEGPMSDSILARTLTLPTMTRSATTSPRSTSATLSTEKPSELGLLEYVLIAGGGLSLILLVVLGCYIMCYKYGFTLRKKKRPTTCSRDLMMDNFAGQQRFSYPNAYASPSAQHPFPAGADPRASGVYAEIPDKGLIGMDDYAGKIYDMGYISPSDFTMPTQYMHEMYDDGTYFMPTLHLEAAANANADFGPMSIAALPTYIIQKKRSNKNGFRQEFEALSTVVAEDDYCLPGKSKPQLPPPPLPGDNPYETNIKIKQNTYDNRMNNASLLRLPYGVNAVFIHGHKKQDAYISAQGPWKDTVNDWWYMIWEKRVVVIVMTSADSENGESICERYWPAEGEVNTYEAISIQNTEEEMYGPQCTLRTLELTKVCSDEVRQIKQFQISSWPEKEGPMFIQPLLLMLDKVKAACPAAGAPILVHCKTGSGRTGVVIAVDAMLDMMRGPEGKVGIYDFVKKMREIRHQMVESEEQYTFIYDALVESILAKKTRIREHDFTEILDRLKKVHQRTKTSKLDDQHLALECLFAMITDGEDKDAKETVAGGGGEGGDQLQAPTDDYINIKQPRLDSTSPRAKLLSGEEQLPNQDEIPYISRPALPGSSSWEEKALDSFFVEGFRSSKAFLVMMSPVVHKEEFWTAVCSSNSQAIIMLDDQSQELPEYLPEKAKDITLDQLTIEMTEGVDRYGLITERELKLTDGKGTDKEESRMIKHFQFRGWKDSMEVPSSAEDFIGLPLAVGACQTNQSKGNPSRRRVIVHSSDESRIGLFCIMANLFDQLQVEGIIDVYSNVKKLRSQFPQMLRSKEQFEFLYKCMEYHLKSGPSNDVNLESAAKGKSPDKSSQSSVGVTRSPSENNPDISAQSSVSVASLPFDDVPDTSAQISAGFASLSSGNNPSVSSRSNATILTGSLGNIYTEAPGSEEGSSPM